MQIGSIPAQAGEPSNSTSRRTRCRPDRVYPRAGGGTSGIHKASCQHPGSIPAQAGEPDPTPSVLPTAIPRSIPAQAGEPTAMPRRGVFTATVGSIPAQAGEPTYAVTSLPPIRRSGSIPAQAGEPPVPTIVDRADGSGSIPAQAGEPTSLARTPSRQTVVSGLSPRRRGNRIRLSMAGRRHVRVYPRAGGGTKAFGLSATVRST